MGNIWSKSYHHDYKNQKILSLPAQPGLHSLKKYFQDKVKWMNLSRRNYLVLKVGWLTESAAGTYSVAISQVFFQI